MTPVSVVIVSRHRPQALVRAMRGVAQQDHAALELVVVACPAGLAAAAASGIAARLVAHDAEGIGAARNAGIDAAAGEVIAFLDDDAVPEPTWITRLIAPFADPLVLQAGGYVIGPDGLSWQWQATEVDATGRDRPFAAAGTVVRKGSARRAIKTQGTNCAFRASALRAAGGFDPGFRFYLDEADVNLRLAPLGLSAVVPGAVVHHGFLPSRRRRADRVPTDLSDIAGSLARFLARHAPGADHARLLADEAAHQRRRLIRHMVAGRVEPRDVGRILATFAAVPCAAPAPLPPRPGPAAAFHPLPTGPRPGRLLQGADRADLLRQAAALVPGHVVTVLIPPRGLSRRRQVFTDAGVWLVEGGRRRPGPGPAAPVSAQLPTEIAAFAAFRPLLP